MGVAVQDVLEYLAGGMSEASAKPAWLRVVNAPTLVTAELLREHHATKPRYSR